MDLTLLTSGLVAVILISGCNPTKFEQMPVSSPTAAAAPDAPVGPVVPSPVVKTAKDSFVQDESANKVDILIIDDNSYSMEVEQKKMAERFPFFVGALTGLDYQIAATTTDIDSADPRLNLGGRVVDWTGSSSKLLNPSSPKAGDLFRDTIKRAETIGCVARGDCPSGNEQPLKALMMAMSQRHGANAGVFRDNVDLAVVVLSDEDEMSNGPISATKPEEVLNAFRTEFGNSKQLRAFGIAIKSGDEACRTSQLAQTSGGQGAYFGTHIEQLAALTGGSVSSICDSDYSKSLAAISQSVRRLVGTFELAQEPRLGSVRVTLTPSSLAVFRVEGRKVIFENPPAAGTRIDVSYELP